MGGYLRWIPWGNRRGIPSGVSWGSPEGTPGGVPWGGVLWESPLGWGGSPLGGPPPWGIPLGGFPGISWGPLILNVSGWGGTQPGGNVLYPGAGLSCRVLVGSEMNYTFLGWGTTSPHPKGG